MKRKPTTKSVRGKATRAQLAERSEESIPSEEVSVAQLSLEAEQLDPDEHRLILAKRVIQTARESLAKYKDLKRLKDSFLVEAGSSADERGPEPVRPDQITGFLQQQAKAASKRLHVKLFDQIHSDFVARNREFTQTCLKGHTRPITACCFNPATSDLVSVAKDGSVVLFDHDAGYKRRLLDPGCPRSPLGHSDELLCLDISFDGKYLVTGGKDRTMKVWNLGQYSKDLAQMKAELARGDFALVAHGKAVPVSHVKRKHSADGLSGLSPQSREAHRPSEQALASQGQQARGTTGLLPRHPQLELLHTFKAHKEAVTALRFRLNSYECVSASADRSMRTWDVAQGGMLETFYGHRAEMLGLACLSENNMVSVGFDKLPIVWKLDRETQMVFDEQPFALDCVHAIDQHCFATGSQDGEVCVWNVGRKKPLLRSKEFGLHGWISSLAGVYNSDFLAVAGQEKTVRLYKIEIKSPKEVIMGPAIDVPSEGVVSGLSVSEDGKWLAVVEGPENRLGRWTVDKTAKSQIRLIRLLL